MPDTSKTFIEGLKDILNSTGSRRLAFHANNKAFVCLSVFRILYLAFDECSTKLCVSSLG